MAARCCARLEYPLYLGSSALIFEELKDIERQPDGAPVAAEDLHKLSVFKDMSPQFFKKNPNATVWRHFKRGELVCREGDFGSTAFYILEGRASVQLASPMAHVKAQGGPGGFWGRLTSKLTSHLAGREEDRREEELDRRSIPIDAPVDLAYDHPVAELGPGELFGEMTCMNYYPRSATVRAETDCTMLEMLRNVLDVLQKSKAFRAQLDETYRRRALDSHLRDVNIFRGLRQDFIDHLRDRVELLRFAPGQVICKQGDPADSFYLVRLGFVKVSENYPGGELVLAYLSRGDYFGEIGLLGGGTRTAACSALDHVEVVRISAEDFRAMVELYPEVRSGLERAARERQEANQERLRMMRSVPLESFLAQGLMEAQSLLVLDLEKCTRCDACVTACADSHDGVTRLVREGLRFREFPGGDFVPPVPRSAVHGGLPGRSDPAAQFARSDHRRLVHWLRAVREKLPVREHQHAFLCRPSRGPRASRAKKGRGAEKGDDLRSVR